MVKRVLRPATLTCPECGFDWYAAPRPFAHLYHPQPLRYRCPNRHCPQSQWIIVYETQMSPVPRVRVVDVVRCFGSAPEAVERSLRQIKSLPPHVIEDMVRMMSLQPERAG